MRFLADQDVYAVTVRLLRAWGHDVALAAEAHLERAHDLELLRTAGQQQRILLTRDRDFGRLVFAGAAGKGVIYLRMVPSTQAAVHSERQQVLALHDEQRLLNAFVVVEPGRHRFRTLHR